jgi:hypothetical protein
MGWPSGFAHGEKSCACWIVEPTQKRIHYFYLVIDMEQYTTHALVVLYYRACLVVVADMSYRNESMPLT